MITEIICGNCEEILRNLKNKFKDCIHLTFLDPPFNQDKEYEKFDDNMPADEYWGFIRRVINEIYEITAEGGAIYFMQREKNTKYVLEILEECGWTFQNLIIWKKLTSAVPGKFRFGKQYQIIAFATKGEKPRVFNRLRIDLPTPPHYKYDRKNGVYVTDIWNDIREMTSGYLAGKEAIRLNDGTRAHKQQSPVHLLLRIILSSTNPGDMVLDPFAGSGTTSVVAKQLNRNSISIEIDPKYVNLIKQRLEKLREGDDISKYYHYYRYTQNLDKIWGVEYQTKSVSKQKDIITFFK